jgi:hypothetical protein
MIHEIVHPEPLSTGNPGGGWKYVRGWLQTILWMIALAAMIYIAVRLR